MPRLPATKLRPPRTSQPPTARPRLEARLDAARGACRATVVSAPAGYGKTTLVASWAARRTPRVAWFAVDPGDDPGGHTLPEADQLVAGWIAAAIEEATGSVVVREGDEGVSALSAALETLSPPWRGVLVFDDAHLLGPPPAAALARWIERAPEGVHTVVVSRRAPHLPVARWLARGDVDTVGADDLRLTPDEGREVVRTLLPDLRADLAASLVDRVEGWPAGIHLAARSLRGRSDPADLIERFTGTDRYVLAFLTEEVLLRLPDDLHEAALLLAGEPRLCAGLVDALIAGSGGAALLERLEAREAFLERLDDRNDDDGPWFRFPGFFRDLLAHRLALARPDLPPVLAERAARWWQRRAQGLHRAAPHAAARSPVAALTAREREVLALLISGASVKATAKALAVSPNTVKTHTRHLFEKLGVKNRVEAAARARDLGLA
jgi:LuxR family transcriptional regulator, maltose regulon positive regulatory protein